jgi:hypothetical protein
VTSLLGVCGKWWHQSGEGLNFTKGLLCKGFEYIC